MYITSDHIVEQMKKLYFWLYFTTTINYNFEQLEPFLWQVQFIWILNLWVWSYGFFYLSVLCILALSICCGNRRLPFKWNVSLFSWYLTFILERLVTKGKKYPFSCFTAVVTYMVWNASIVATNVFTHLMCLNRKVGWRLYNLDLFHKNFNQWNKHCKLLNYHSVYPLYVGSAERPHASQSVYLCEPKVPIPTKVAYMHFTKCS